MRGRRIIGSALASLLLAAALVGVLASVSSGTTPGQIDTTFGSGIGAGAGFTFTPVGTGGTGTGVRSLHELPSGNLLVAGTATESGGHRAVLMRYLPDGHPDTTFNSGAPIEYDIGSGHDATGAGAVFLSGSGFALAGDALDGGVQKVFVDLLTIGGQPQSGGLTLTALAADANVQSLVVDAAGRLLVGGTEGTGTSALAFVARYSATGALDTTFGNHGVATIDLSGSGLATHALGLATDQNAVWVAGWAANGGGTNQSLLAELDANGALVPGFGSGGIALGSFGDGTSTIAEAVDLHADDSAVVVGKTHAGSVTKAFDAHYTTAGQLDSGFGGPSIDAASPAGVRIFDVVAGDDEVANAVTTAAAGDTIAGSDTGSARQLFVALLTPTGDDGRSITQDTPGPGSAVLAIGDGGDTGAQAVIRHAKGHLVTLAGHAVNGGATGLAIAQFGVHTPPVAAFGISWDHHGFPDRPLRPDQTATFNPGPANDPDGEIVNYEWDFNGTSNFATATTDPTPQTHSYPLCAGCVQLAGGPSPDTHHVTLRVTDNEGKTDVLTKDVTVAANIAPTAALGLRLNGIPLAQPPLYQNTPGTLFAAASSDPDGAIVDYQWDLDNDGKFETDSGDTPSVSHTFKKLGQHTIGLKVTDDEGATNAGTFAVTVDCSHAIDPTKLIHIQLAAGADASTCLHESVTTKTDGTIERSYHTEAAVTVDGLKVKPDSPASDNQVNIEWDTSKTGKLKVLTLKSSSAAVSATAQNAPVSFSDGKVSWDLSGKTSAGRTIAGFKYSNTLLGGLDTTVSSVRLKPRATLTMKLAPHLPADMVPGQKVGQTPNKLINLTLGADASAAQAEQGFNYEVSNVDLGPLHVDTMHLYFLPAAAPDGSDLWGMDAHVSLDLLVKTIHAGAGMELLTTFSPGHKGDPRYGTTHFHAAYLDISGDPNIFDTGYFALNHVFFQVNAGPDFTTTKLTGATLPPFGDSQTQQDESNFNSGVDSSGSKNGKTCVPYIGKVDFYTGKQVTKEHPLTYGAQVRDPSYMYTLYQEVKDSEIEDPSGSGHYETLERYYQKHPKRNLLFRPVIVDYRTPDLALCGGVDFSILEVADISAFLGYAHYASAPTDVFWFDGKISLLDLIQGEVLGEVWSDGYTHININAGGDYGWLKWSVGFDYEAFKQLWNADGWADVDITAISLSAGAEALASNRGLSICLQLKFFGADWNPGASMKWGQGPDFYLSGCDVNKYKVVIDHPSFTRSTVGTMPTPGLTAAPIKIAPGLPGTTLAIHGDGAPPHVILTDPSGRTFDTGDGSDPVFEKATTTSGEAFAAFHDRPVGRQTIAVGPGPIAPTRSRVPAVQSGSYTIPQLPANVTEIAISNPKGGTWRIAPAPGSAAIVDVQQADGLAKPDITAKVKGSGFKRTLSFGVKGLPSDDQVVFSEAGQGGGTMIGSVHGRALSARAAGASLSAFRQGSLKFTPGVGRKETRPIFATVLDYRGLPRERIQVTSYSAPAPPKPAKVRRVRASRAGGNLVLTWAAGRGSSRAKTYDLLVQLSDGRVLRFHTSTPRVTIPGVGRTTTADVNLSPVSTLAIAGPSLQTSVKGLPLAHRRR